MTPAWTTPSTVWTRTICAARCRRGREAWRWLWRAVTWESVVAPAARAVGIWPVWRRRRRAARRSGRRLNSVDGVTARGAAAASAGVDAADAVDAAGDTRDADADAGVPPAEGVCPYRRSSRPRRRSSARTRASPWRARPPRFHSPGRKPQFPPRSVRSRRTCQTRRRVSPHRSPPPGSRPRYGACATCSRSRPSGPRGTRRERRVENEPPSTKPVNKKTRRQSHCPYGTEIKRNSIEMETHLTHLVPRENLQKRGHRVGLAASSA